LHLLNEKMGNAEKNGQRKMVCGADNFLPLP